MNLSKYTIQIFNSQWKNESEDEKRQNVENKYRMNQIAHIIRRYIETIWKPWKEQEKEIKIEKLTKNIKGKADGNNKNRKIHIRISNIKIQEKIAYEFSSEAHLLVRLLVVPHPTRAQVSSFWKHDCASTTSIS